jgi:hypothetical protein
MRFQLASRRGTRRNPTKPAMETPLSPIDSTNSLPTSRAIFSASFMDTGRWLRAAGDAAGVTSAVEVKRAALEVEQAALELKQGARWAGYATEGGAAGGDDGCWRAVALEAASGWGRAAALGAAGGWGQAARDGAARGRRAVRQDRLGQVGASGQVGAAGGRRKRKKKHIRGPYI